MALSLSESLFIFSFPFSPKSSAYQRHIRRKYVPVNIWRRSARYSDMPSADANLQNGSLLYNKCLKASDLCRIQSMRTSSHSRSIYGSTSWWHDLQVVNWIDPGVEYTL
jgi:hypothetical protein